ncbi:hypothetical protein [Pseudomonas reactans]
MLAKVVNENAVGLDTRGAFAFFASKLAPTGNKYLKVDFCKNKLNKPPFLPIPPESLAD